MRWVRERVDPFLAGLHRRVGTGWPLAARLAHLAIAVAVSSVVAATHNQAAPLWGFTVVAAVAGILAVLDASSAWSTGTLATVVVQYLFGFINVQAPTPGPLTLYALIAGLYLMHATAALAAALPPLARVEPAVILRWAARTVVVLVVTVPLAALPSVAEPASRGPWMVIGFLGAAALVLLPLLVFRRRSP
ncbi:MAG: hypothetical protein ACRDMV_11210 [Streptosporangiales bacterium]